MFSGWHCVRLFHLCNAPHAPSVSLFDLITVVFSEEHKLCLCNFLHRSTFFDKLNYPGALRKTLPWSWSVTYFDNHCIYSVTQLVSYSVSHLFRQTRGRRHVFSYAGSPIR
jgi:hypothetical protein